MVDWYSLVARALRDISQIYLSSCPCSSIRNQDQTGSSFGEAFVEQVLEGSLDPKFATSGIFLGCIILSSSFSTAMTHLQVEVIMVQKTCKMSSICLLVNLRTCKQLWAPICYCSQDLDRWCPPPPSAAPQPPCSPPNNKISTGHITSMRRVLSLQH